MDSQQALRSLIINAIALHPARSATMQEINSTLGWNVITRYKTDYSIPAVTSHEVLNLMLGQMVLQRKLNIVTRDGVNCYAIAERDFIPPDHTAEIEDLKERVKALEDLVRNLTRPA
jgi:hypothetical protein